MLDERDHEKFLGDLKNLPGYTKARWAGEWDEYGAPSNMRISTWVDIPTSSSGSSRMKSVISRVHSKLMRH